MKLNATELKVIKGDITELAVDAIVNAANNKLEMGGGVAGAIRKKGGREIEAEAMQKGPIKIGEAISTSAEKLKAKYVIHAATMGMDFKTDELKIRASCAAALIEADRLKLKSVAFPALGCGVGGFPLLAAAKIMAQEVFKHIRERDSKLQEIVFCLYDDEAFAVFDKTVNSYLNYIVHKLSNGPFTTVDSIIEIPARPGESGAGGDGGLVVIERSNPPFGFALPGGFVDYGESLEDAVIRETKEETNLEITELKQFHTYSFPQRDPRFHTIGTVFIAKAKGTPKAGDDAKGLKVIPLQELESLEFAFDHKRIILDYLAYKKTGALP